LLWWVCYGSLICELEILSVLKAVFRFPGSHNLFVDGLEIIIRVGVPHVHEKLLGLVEVLPAHCRSQFSIFLNPSLANVVKGLIQSLVSRFLLLIRTLHQVLQSQVQMLLLGFLRVQSPTAFILTHF
jgi:hypothetical protein